MSVNEEFPDGWDRDRIDLSSAVGPSLKISLDPELSEAVEAWRLANGMVSKADAGRELMRLGLLSEISKVYDMVVEMRSKNEQREAEDD
jgi:hypothetical protein